MNYIIPLRVFLEKIIKDQELSSKLASPQQEIPLLYCVWLFRYWDNKTWVYGLKAGLVMVSIIDLLLAVGLGTRILEG